jgi:hypothetical protein
LGLEAYPHEGCIPRGFGKTRTHTRRNPYPWARVRVFWGTGAGSPGKPQGYPCQSLLSSDRRAVVVDEYEEEELTPAMVELLNVIEERENYKSQVDTTQAALRDSLAREEQLKSELDNTRAMLCNTSPSLHVARLTSPIAHPTTPSPSSHNRFDRFSHVSPTPPSHRSNAYKSLSPANRVTRRLFANAVASPSHYEGSSEYNGSVSASRAIDALAEYNDFLNSHKIIHLKSTLDVIRHTFPISSWALQLEGAGIPSDLIDSVMIFMVAANT